MTERFSDQDPQQEVRAAIAERVAERLQWLNEAAELIGGPGATVEEVFERPVVEGNTARDDAPMPDWTPEQTEKMLAIGRRFGYGAQETVMSGIPGGVRIREGGKVWKMMAEDVAFDEEEATFGDEEMPHTKVYCGNIHRPLGTDELTFLREKQGIELPEGAAEYDFAMVLAKQKAEIIYERPLVLPYGYALTPGNRLRTRPTGQVVQVGESARGQAHIVMQASGEQYFDETEQRLKERNRPDTARVMSWWAEVLTAQGKLNDPIVEGTSNTYTSRVPDTERASLNLDPPRQLGVVMYGRKAIGALGAPVPKEMPLNHLPGDLRLMYDKLLQLEAALQG